MTREEAKTWMTVPEHTLRIIAPCIYFNPDVVKAYADGAEVEYHDGYMWRHAPDPSFCLPYIKWRIKPDEKLDEPYETWKPNVEQVYYYVANYGMDVWFTTNANRESDQENFAVGNFFKSSEDAKIAANLVREAFSNSKKMIDQEKAAKK